MRNTELRLLGLSLLALAACLNGFAQSTVTGELVGTVTDPSGAIVAAGKVTVLSDATGEAQTSAISSAANSIFRCSGPVSTPSRWSPRDSSGQRRK